MSVDVLLGLQWGDEGKGKIVDVLTPRYDIIARFQGGPNAGHSLEFNNTKHILHLIPSGVFHPDKYNIIGNGVVLDPSIFRKEVRALEDLGVHVTQTLYISRKAHLILPTHRLLDAAYEKSKGKSKIGSTLKGIGPAYTDKISRNGLRVGDIHAPDFRKRYKALTEKHMKLLQVYGLEYSLSQAEEGWFEGIELMKAFTLVDTEYFIHNSINEKRAILAEGAQGTLLDVDFGSYPFVTSSNTVCAGACTGLGIAPREIGEVYGIFKAYCTRVGSGPFPTEDMEETGDRLRKQGAEFGSTTGRPRRCGWMDLPALKYAVMLNGVTQLIMTKADVLSGFEKLKICTAYEVDGKITHQLPFDVNREMKPVYTEIPGWEEDISSIRNYADLPASMRDYVDMIEEEVNVPVRIISVGADREKTIFR